jgi:hypothetical protein
MAVGSSPAKMAVGGSCVRIREEPLGVVQRGKAENARREA